MFTTTDPEAWRAISPVSMVTVLPPHWKVFFAISNTSIPFNIARAISPAARFACQQSKTRNPQGLLAGFGSVLSTAQTESFDQRLVARRARSLQVVEQLAAPADHLQQAAARMVVFRVRLEVVGQFDDPGGEQRNLDFRRAGVVLATLVVGDDLRLVDVGDSHEFPWVVTSTCGIAGLRCRACSRAPRQCGARNPRSIAGRRSARRPLHRTAVRLLGLARVDEI